MSQLTPDQRAPVERIRDRPRRRMSRVDLAVRLVESGAATCRRAAILYQLDAIAVLDAFNAANPDEPRSFT